MVIHTEPWQIKKNSYQNPIKIVLNQSFALKCEGVKLLPLKINNKNIYVFFFYIQLKKWH